MIRNKAIIYQIIPRLFGPNCSNHKIGGTIDENGCGKFNDITNKALSEFKNLGITDIWLTGIIRHSSSSSYPDANIESSHSDILKGKAGSPYAIKDYYDLDPDLAENVSKRWEEFERLLNRIKDLDLGAIIDFVPNHVSRDYQTNSSSKQTRDFGVNDNKSLAFHPENNFYYIPDSELTLPIKSRNRKKDVRFKELPAKATGNDIFNPSPNTNDWYETIKLNYGHDFETNIDHFYPTPDTWIKMLEILDFWAEKGISGFRCDMAGMVPSAFWKFAISSIKTKHPKIVFIAEIYEPDRYFEYINAGFDFLYDKVGLYDKTRSIIQDQGSARSISDHWKSMNGLDDKMLRFLENHDEQRIASRFFASDPLKALPGIALAALMNAGPVLIYFGQEVGEPALGKVGFSGDDGRTSIFDYTSLPELNKWINNGNYDGALLSEKQKNLRLAYQQILLYASRNPVFANGSFYDLMWINEDMPSEIQDKVYAFLRYYKNDYYLIAVNFSQRIKEVKIRITDHPLKAMGIDHHDRFNVETLHPYPDKQYVLLSQLISSGVRIKFDYTGWSALKISV